MMYNSNRRGGILSSIIIYSRGVFTLLDMKGFQTTGFILTIIISVFDASIALFSAFLSAILWGFEYKQVKVKNARLIFLYLLCFVVIHAIMSIVVAIMSRNALKERKILYVVFNTLLPAAGIGAVAAFYCLYITYTRDFFGSIYDPDHRVILPLVVLYCLVCAINLILAVIAGLTWSKAR